MHEINNTKGHTAGNEMLKYIANTLRAVFRYDMTYRIGGDEFVIFLKKRKLPDIEAELAVFAETLRKKEYHASIGLCSHEKRMNLDDIIKSAEKRMYENKKKYYDSIGKDVRNIK